MISRRRFLSLSACAMGFPAHATPTRWRGFALGAEVQISLYAPPEQAKTAMQACKAQLKLIERQFSLYDPNSALSKLNREGALAHPHAWMQDILMHCDTVNRETSGVFDPTIQPLWHALSLGVPTDAAQQALGWHRVKRSPQQVTLDTGQALTLNGIAQGYATDVIKSQLAALGLQKSLINIGEFAALGGPFHIGVEDPKAGLVTTRHLTNQAIATSSPGALQLDARHTHILNPKGADVVWNTISVTAKTATIADAVSTAFCMMTFEEIAAAKSRLPGIHEVIAVDHAGQITTI